MEDSSSNASSEYPTDTESDLRETEQDCAPDISDGWQCDLKLGECMLRLFDAGLWTDISFRCSDQSEENLDDRIHAHKIVLAARSPVFQAMFFGPCQDGNKVIEIHDVESQDFKLFLRLLYSDLDDTTHKYDDLVGVLEIAHKYQVTNLVDECCRKLAELINEDNACSILDRALLFGNNYLIKQAVDFIDAKAYDVLESDGFLDVSVTCLAYILKGDTFYAKESVVFKRAIEWAKRKCKSTDGQVVRSALGEAFFHLRTPCMSLKDLVDCTHRKGYYTAEEYEDIMGIIGMSKQTEPKCNSTQKRFPLVLEMERLPLESSKPKDEKSIIKNGTITETVSISSYIDLYVTSVTLVHREHLFHPEKLYIKTWNYQETSNEFKMQNLPVSVSLKFGNNGTIKSEVLAGPRTPCIELPKPLFLSAGKSITLQVDVTLDKIPNFQLSADRCFSVNEFRTIVPGTVYVKTQEKSARVVHSLRFKCVNNRDKSKISTTIVKPFCVEKPN